METVRPEVLIPVHTENPGFFRRFEGMCRVVENSYKIIDQRRPFFMEECLQGQGKQ